MTSIPAHTASSSHGTESHRPTEPGHRFSAGKLLILFVALVAPLGAFAADWNVTHIYNPNWPPHAKFHNGQTMTFAIVLGALSVWFLWFRRQYGLAQLRLAITFAALYWVAQTPAILYPGAAFYDPEFAADAPELLGVELNQIMLCIFFFIILAAGYGLEQRRLRQVAEDAPVVPSSPAAS